MLSNLGSPAVETQELNTKKLNIKTVILNGYILCKLTTFEQKP